MTAKKIIITVIIIILVLGVFWFISLHKSVDQVQTQEQQDILTEFNEAKQTKPNTVVEETKEMEKQPTQPTQETKTTTPTPAETTTPTQPQQPTTQQPQTPTPTQTTQADQNTLRILKKGVFNPDAEDSDSIHRGWGDVSLIERDGKRFVIFDENFRVTPGPDYYLYLVPQHGVETESVFNSIKSNSTRVTRIRQHEGKQIHEIPSNYSISGNTGIVIWCESFSQFITTADLK